MRKQHSLSFCWQIQARLRTAFLRLATHSGRDPRLPHLIEKSSIAKLQGTGGLATIPSMRLQSLQDNLFLKSFNSLASSGFETDRPAERSPWIQVLIFVFL